MVPDQNNKFYLVTRGRREGGKGGGGHVHKLFFVPNPRPFKTPW